MGAEIEPFNFNGNMVRVVVIDGEPWFVTGDVAKILGYREASRITRRLDDDEISDTRLMGSAQTVSRKNVA